MEGFPIKCNHDLLGLWLKSGNWMPYHLD